MNKDLIFIIENMSPIMQKELLRQYAHEVGKPIYFYKIIKENNHGAKELKTLMGKILKFDRIKNKLSKGTAKKTKTVKFSNDFLFGKKKKVVKKKKAVVKKKKKVVKKKK
tara:strand:+ start:103 stop:432 length:330 start_codon:yes stop_codon:yes gene_type:complete